VIAKKRKVKVDIKAIGVPNICFSMVKPGDERNKLYKKQRQQRGFDDSELWSLNDTIASFIIPRLKEFREQSTGDDDWRIMLYKMIDAFELSLSVVVVCHKDRKRYDEGMKLLCKHFLGLWW
jgi:hypothetical protein